MPYTIGLLRSIPRLDEEQGAKLTPIRGLPPDLINLPEICPFSPRCDYFVAGKCDQTVPPLRPVGPEHRAACLFDITLETPIPEKEAVGAEAGVA
jgi:oligopeptide transport system ATP-binding protein